MLGKRKSQMIILLMYSAGDVIVDELACANWRSRSGKGRAGGRPGCRRADDGAARQDKVARDDRAAVQGKILALKLPQGAFDPCISVEGWCVPNHNRVDGDALHWGGRGQRRARRQCRGHSSTGRQRGRQRAGVFPGTSDDVEDEDRPIMSFQYKARIQIRLDVHTPDLNWRFVER